MFEFVFQLSNFLFNAELFFFNIDRFEKCYKIFESIISERKKNPIKNRKIAIL